MRLKLEVDNLHYDSESMLYLAINTKAKHIDIIFHFITHAILIKILK